MEKQRALILEKVLFTSTKPNDNVHRCVVAIDVSHAASYRHGHHSQLKMDDKVMLYNVIEPMIQYESAVVAISESLDVIVFKLIDRTFENFPRNTETLYCGMEYLHTARLLRRSPNLGVKPLWKQGIISERRRGFYIGSSHGQVGDSGSGIFDCSGFFLGISVAKKSLAFSDRENMPVGEIADHHPDTRIVSSEVIFGFSGLVDKEFEPTGKCARVV
ncbi:unnamed protein product [Caenorhabditis sp. 36 PRJEB53466]|nr:unnamed protein product [Caenorhabditis sp. 36 PRJEB53466]